MPRDDTSYYEDLNPDKASKTGGLTAAELIREIKANFPNLEKDIITEFKIEGRPHSERRGEAISTRTIEGPRQSDRPGDAIDPIEFPTLNSDQQ